MRDVRLAPQNERPVREDRPYVVYWMIAQRRTEWNFALEYAAEAAERLGKQLVVFEALRVGYRWASDRLHRFVIEGMVDNRERLKGTPALYFPYVEPHEGHGRGLLEAWAERAALVVTDDFPCFFLPRMVRAAADKLDVRMVAVDSNGLLPLRATDRVFTRAHDFRRYLHKTFRDHAGDQPARDPLAGRELAPGGVVPEAISKGWPAADLEALLEPGGLASLPIDHTVGPVEASPGGSEAARDRVYDFLDSRLMRYGDDRNHPERQGSSGLSPWLHFGHVSAHEIFAGIVAREDWDVGRLATTTKGQREGWWGMSGPTEGFLDELVTWREVGYNMTSKIDNYDRFESLPDWAQRTLEEHAADPREYVYDLDQFDAAETHDELWNAAQLQLRADGRIHNYLRMLWGKKILHWSEHPRAALDILIELNNKYALDGRNPNSYSGIFWVLGRYDRAWGPERPIFGKIRYMTCDSTRRKYKVNRYIAHYSGGGSQLDLI